MSVCRICRIDHIFTSGKCLGPRGPAPTATATVADAEGATTDAGTSPGRPAKAPKPKKAAAAQPPRQAEAGQSRAELQRAKNREWRRLRAERKAAAAKSLNGRDGRAA